MTTVFRAWTTGFSNILVHKFFEQSDQPLSPTPRRILVTPRSVTIPKFPRSPFSRPVINLLAEYDETGLTAPDIADELHIRSGNILHILQAFREIDFACIAGYVPASYKCRGKILQWRITPKGRDFVHRELGP